MNLFEMMDQAIANELGITVEEYVERIEWLLERDYDKGKELVDEIFDGKEHACENFMKATQDYLKDC
jgi:hypothetical protein